jgi:hypothetical protein
VWVVRVEVLSGAYQTSPFAAAPAVYAPGAHLSVSPTTGLFTNCRQEVFSETQHRPGPIRLYAASNDAAREPVWCSAQDPVGFTPTSRAISSHFQ